MGNGADSMSLNNGDLSAAINGVCGKIKVEAAPAQPWVLADCQAEVDRFYNEGYDLTVDHYKYKTQLDNMAKAIQCNFKEPNAITFVVQSGGAVYASEFQTYHGAISGYQNNYAATCVNYNNKCAMAYNPQAILK